MQIRNVCGADTFVFILWNDKSFCLILNEYQMTWFDQADFDIVNNTCTANSCTNKHTSNQAWPRCLVISWRWVIIHKCYDFTKHFKHIRPATMSNEIHFEIFPIRNQQCKFYRKYLSYTSIMDMNIWMTMTTKIISLYQRQNIKGFRFNTVFSNYFANPQANRAATPDIGPGPVLS